MPGSAVPVTFPGLLAGRQAGAGPPLPAESVHQAPGRGPEAGPESPVALSLPPPPPSPSLQHRVLLAAGGACSPPGREGRGKANGTNDRPGTGLHLRAARSREQAGPGEGEQGGGGGSSHLSGASREERGPPRRPPPPPSTVSSFSSRGEWSRRCRPGWDPPADTSGAPGCGDGAGAGRLERRKEKNRLSTGRGGRRATVPAARESPLPGKVSASSGGLPLLEARGGEGGEGKEQSVSVFPSSSPGEGGTAESGGFSPGFESPSALELRRCSGGGTLGAPRAQRGTSPLRRRRRCSAPPPARPSRESLPRLARTPVSLPSPPGSLFTPRPAPLPSGRDAFPLRGGLQP